MNNGLFDKAKEVMGEFTGNVKRFFDDYDFASLPAFLLFMVVITAGMTVNYYFLVSKIGIPSLEALAVSLLFEFGIAAWKFQGHRVKNSKAQKDAVNVALWISVILASLMLIASLTGRVWWTWVVALAAGVHVVSFLIFDQNDDIRENRRENKSAQHRITQKNITVDNAIQEAEADLKIIQKITSELGRLRSQHATLPVVELEFVLEATRNRLLKEYKASANVASATAKLADINGDNHIGNKPSNPPTARGN